MKNLNIYALANELNLGEAKSGTIRVPFGRWDFGAKKLDDGRNLFFVQELTKDGAERMAAKIGARPCGVAVTLDFPAERTAKDATELAATLKSAGYLVDQGELEKARQGVADARSKQVAT